MCFPLPKVSILSFSLHDIIKASRLRTALSPSCMPAGLLVFLTIYCAWCTPTLAAGTPEQTLLQYYQAAKQENLAEYYGLQYTPDLSEAELALRKEITRELWRRFDTRESTVQDFRVVQDHDLAVARYNLAATLVGPTDKGKTDVLQRYGRYTAIFVRQAADDWKLAAVNNANDFNSIMHASFRQQATEHLLAVLDGIPENDTEAPLSPPPAKEMLQAGPVHGGAAVTAPAVPETPLPPPLEPEPEDRTASSPVPEIAAAAAVQKLPPSPANLETWVAVLLSGQEVLVTLDQLKVDDNGWTGDWRSDPLGVIKAGETYTVFFASADGTYSATGMYEPSGDIQTHTTMGIDPADGLISIWGRTFNFDGKGRVWDPEFGIAGTLSLKATRPATAPPPLAPDVAPQAPSSPAQATGQPLPGETGESAPAASVAPPVDLFSGKWATTYGDLLLRLDDGRVNGLYGTNDGMLSGEIVDGVVLRGFWSEAGNRCPEPREGRKSWGNFEFRFSAEKSFMGRWGFCGGEMNSSWNGTRKDSEKRPFPDPGSAIVPPLSQAATDAAGTVPERPARPGEMAIEKEKREVAAPEETPNLSAKATLKTAAEAPLDTVVPEAMQTDAPESPGNFQLNGEAAPTTEADTPELTQPESAADRKATTDPASSRESSPAAAIAPVPAPTAPAIAPPASSPSTAAETQGMQEAAQPLPPSAGEAGNAMAAEPPEDIFSGVWATNYGELTLQTAARQVTGNYTSKGGMLSGTIVGDSLLQGYWSETGRANQCATERDGRRNWGRFAFHFTTAGTFRGTWGYCDKSLGGDWNGILKNSPVPLMPPASILLAPPADGSHRN